MADDTKTFIDALFSGKPEEAAVQVWHKDSKKNFYYDVLDTASTLVAGIADHDVYIAAGLAPKALKPSRTRTAAQGIIGIPGVWADIDVNGGPEHKTGAAADTDQALELACSLLEPTLIVNSGHGIQAWWLWEDGPWIFTDHTDQAHGAGVVRGFQGALKAQARRMGFGLDATHDLARLMRVPGTFNHKDKGSPAPVTIVVNQGNRYSIEDVSALAQNVTSGAVSAQTLGLQQGEGIEIEVRQGAQPPLKKLSMIIDALPEFKSVWDHRATASRATWTMSEYEMSITGRLVDAGWTDQEICDALVYYRNEHDSANAQRKNRRDRLATTIGRARAGRPLEEAEREAIVARNTAADELASLVHEDEPSEVRAISLFNRVIGGPEIAELVQDSTDVDLARYKLILADGREVPLGKIDNLVVQDNFRRRYATVTRHYFVTITQKKWDAAIQVLLRTTRVNDSAEDTRTAIVVGWLESYLESRASTERDGACQKYDPFIVDEMVHVPAGPLLQWLKRAWGERMDIADLRMMLQAAGFERKTIAYTLSGTNGNGKTRSTRSYYVAPDHVLEAGRSEV